ncbi:unnamed protein product [Pleuronectes platessa]|uniref:Uncharacterized protein n=1 Tax=Pleuronectes platessa TaxID=8262 RepID=A0A9N7TP10_PLEPL|nr:unnamed protein product [Pleuronectes platessa]
MEHDYSDIMDRSRSLYVSEIEEAFEPQESTRTVHQQKNRSGHHELLKKLDEYKNLTEKIQTENKNQLATLNNLQSQCDSLRYQSMRLSESQTENTQLSADLHSTRVNEKDLIKRNKTLTARVAHLEHLTDKHEGEIQRLKTERSTLQTQLEDVLKDGDVRTRQEHRELVMADQMQLTSLTEKHGKENQELKTEVQVLKFKLEEAQRLIESKDNLISEQCREITCKENLRQNAWALESQAIEHLQQESPDVEVEQESPDVEVGQESPDVEVQQESPDVEVQQECPEVEVQQESPDVEVQQESPDVEVQQESPDVEVEQESPDVEVEQESPDVEVQQESPDVEVQQESPDVEVPQQASPARYCKWLLPVFLCLFIVAVCLFNLAPPLLDGLASHWDLSCELIRPLYNHQPIPF